MGFEEKLPRVYELKAMLTNPSHPNAYFQKFEESLGNNRLKLAAMQELECQLAVLDDRSWADLNARAVVHLISRVRQTGRGCGQRRGASHVSRGLDNELILE